MLLKCGISVGLCFLLLLIDGTSSETSVKEELQRTKRQLSMFEIVRFANFGCDGSGTKNGTCYTAQECTDRNGVAAGSCANGFGVCCTVTLGCGGTATDNCTYFDSASMMSAGSCRAQICRQDNNICQLRLDFTTFVITGPSTSSLPVGKLLFGRLNAAGAQPASQATQCLTDTFSVTGGSGNNLPVICGTNTGEHIYVDAAETCNELTFNLGANANGVPAVANRMWSIKVSQYSCDFDNLAPQGCTQYYFGPTTDIVKSFNFDGGVHLADQEQVICTRRERGMCRICYTVTTNADFMVSGKTNVNQGFTQPDGCCSHARKTVIPAVLAALGVLPVPAINVLGANTNGFDCVQIQGGFRDNNVAETASKICGRRFADADASGISRTICTTRQPFMVQFRSDSYELTTGNFESVQAMKNIGVRLTYTMDSVGCP